MTTTTVWRFTFDRIGRTHNPPDLTVEAETLTTPEVVDALYRHCSRYLRSHGFGVYFEAPEPDDPGKVWIDGGRYGTGRVEIVEVPA